MKTVIALLRGVNVGGHGKLPMRELAAILEDIGCIDVETYIQSGNVVFNFKNGKSDKLRKTIASRIHNSHGFEPNIILLEKAELDDAIEKNPFPTDDGKMLHFYFLEIESSKPNLTRLRDLRSETEQSKLTSRVFYLYTPNGFGRSKLASNVEQVLGVSATARNWNTISKLATLAAHRTIEG